jgi:hypothetical protein
MSPLRHHMLAALQLSGKGERTHEASVRAVRLLAQFYHTSPTVSLHRSFSTPSCTEKTSTALPQRPCVSAMQAVGTFV